MVREVPARRSVRLGLRAERWCPPALNADQQAQLRAAVRESPEQAGVTAANWNWKVVREFVRGRFGFELCRSACLKYLHRLGFVLKRPKKRLLKADEQQREAFIARYVALCAEARAQGADRIGMHSAILLADSYR